MNDGHTGKKIQNYVFNYVDFLGNGNFSKCYKARNTKTNQEVAIKIVELNSLKSKKLEQLLFSEIQVLKQMNHPNVLRCLQVFTSNRNCYIITQICNEGDLESKIKKKQRLQDYQINNIIADVYKGLKYLASKEIIHRDLKIANIFVHKGVAKIADFGFALHSKCNFRDLNIGSPLYMSPQGILDNIYGSKTDIWAFGIMIYELYHGKTPFNHCITQQQLRENVVRPLQWNQFRADLPNDIKQLILSCLQIRQDRRPNIHQLINNSFLHNVVHNRQIQMNTELRFRSPLKQNSIKLGILGQERGRSTMKVRSAYSTQDQTMISHNSFQRHLSPNKNIYNSASYNRNNSANNYQSANNFYDARNMNINNSINTTIITLPTPSLKKNVTITEKSPPLTMRSPLDNKSLNKIQPIQSNYKQKNPYIVTSQINFKECVNILHYCRLIFKYLQCYKQFTKLQKHKEKQCYSWLGQFLIWSLEEIYDSVICKKIKYEGQNPQVREKKLIEVTDQYRKKYNKQLDNQILKKFYEESLRYELNLNKIAQIALSALTNLWINERSSNHQLIIGQLLLTIYSSSLLLQQCFIKKTYSSFQKYKQIQQVLNRTKDNFTFKNYSQHKNRVLNNKNSSIL